MLIFNCKFCVILAWLQVSEGKAAVTAVFKTSSGFVHAGTAHSEAGCWSMLKGGLTVNVSGPAEVYFEVKASIVNKKYRSK